MQNHLNLDEMMSSFCISFTLFLVSKIFSHKFTYKAMEIHLRFYKHLFSVAFLLVAYAYLRVLHHVHTNMYWVSTPNPKCPIETELLLFSLQAQPHKHLRSPSVPDSESCFNKISRFWQVTIADGAKAILSLYIFTSTNSSVKCGVKRIMSLGGRLD